MPNQTFTSYHSKTNSLFTSQKNWKPEIRSNQVLDQLPVQSPEKNLSSKFVTKKRKQSNSNLGNELLQEKQQALNLQQNADEAKAKNHIRFL